VCIVRNKYKLCSANFVNEITLFTGVYIGIATGNGTSANGGVIDQSWNAGKQISVSLAIGVAWWWQLNLLANWRM